MYNVEKHGIVLMKVKLIYKSFESLSVEKPLNS